MLTHEKKQALLELHRQDVPLREISRLLKVSRNTVRRVLREETSPPQRKPTGKWQSVLSQLPELHSRARGNAVRIQELVAEEFGVQIPYSTLTHLLRREQLSTPAPKRSGIYHYEPGAEMHQDTSPHRIEIGGKSLTAQCAGLILPFSRFAFVQYYPAFTRFEAKVFLTAAFGFINGTCPRCTIDNTSVLVVAGSGPEATIAPEMQAFGEHFSVRFIPHAIGHADRKAHIERLFSFVEGNFLAARTFADWADLNAQALRWCESVANHKIKRELGTSPRAAFEQERPFLQPLPVYIPPVYDIVHRGVDTQGYVHLDTNRYSVPERLLGKQVEVLKYFDRVVVHFQGKAVAEHVRRIGQRYARATLKGHHGPLGRRRQRAGPSPEEQQLIGQQAVLDGYVAALKKRSPGRGVAKLKRLLNLKRTYPAAPFLAAIEQAAQYGLYDLSRLEALILKQVAGSFFDFEALD